MKLFRRRERSPSLHLSRSVERVDNKKRLEFAHDAKKNTLRRILDRFFNLIKRDKQNNK